MRGNRTFLETPGLTGPLRRSQITRPGSASRIPVPPATPLRAEFKSVLHPFRRRQGGEPFPLTPDASPQRRCAFRHLPRDQKTSDDGVS
jgi:hypothetical protein